MARRNLDAAVTGFLEAVGVLVRRARAQMVLHDLSWSESAVIGRLARHGPMTTAELARAEGVKPQSMGTTIAELEDKGLVHRKPHPTDGRQFNIELTAKGVAARKSTYEAKHKWLSHAIAQLDERERETLFAAGDVIKRLVERE
jgi:DNA-binding MarR family transcriptional regulator